MKNYEPHEKEASVSHLRSICVFESDLPDQVQDQIPLIYKAFKCPWPYIDYIILAECTHK